MAMNLGLLKLMLIFSVFMSLTGAYAEWNSDEVSTVQSDSSEAVSDSSGDSVSANPADEDEDDSDDSDDF